MNSFCVTEFYATKFLKQKETMVTQIPAASPSPNFHSGKSYVKKITVFTFQQFVPTFHVKLKSLYQKMQFSVFQGQDFAFRAAINMFCREITAKSVTLISFLTLISLKTCFTLVNNNIYWQKRLNWAFLMMSLQNYLYKGKIRLKVEHFH